MKKFFAKVKNWFIAHKPSKRRLIQVYAALLYNANIKGFTTGKIYGQLDTTSNGVTKNFCVPGMNCYSCPGAVGSCPLGSLQNALEKSGSGAFAYVFGIIVLFGLLLGRTICGFLCPVGLGQELLYKIRSPKLGKSVVTRILSYFKYILLATLVVLVPIMTGAPGFCQFICPAGTFGGAGGLLIGPSAPDFFVKLNILFSWKSIILILTIAASIFIFRPFCRFICPLGAIYGFFCRVALLGIKLDKNKCIDCGLCVTECKMDIHHVGDHECINCGKCIPVCPTKAISWKGSQIFLHPTSAEVKAVESQVGGISLTENGVVAQTNATVNVVMPHPMTKVEGSENLNEAISKRVKKRNKVLEIVAWSLASVLLVSSLVYYNFIDGSKKIVREGAILPSFTTSSYSITSGGSGDYNASYTYKPDGEKATVLYFWNEESEKNSAGFDVIESLLNNAYASKTSFVAVYSGTKSKKEVSDMMGKQDYVYYAQLGTTFCLGGKAILEEYNVTISQPLTIIVDKSGKVVKMSESIVYDDTDKILATLSEGKSIGYLVGNVCPDFTVELMRNNKSMETFKLSDHIGKVVVINFWQTTCTPCKEELPYFNKLQTEHPDDVVIIAMDAQENTVYSKAQLQAWIDSHEGTSWADYSLLFGYDSNIVSSLLGVGAAFPYTLILDKDGVVQYRYPKAVEETELYTAVGTLLAK